MSKYKFVRFISNINDVCVCVCVCVCVFTCRQKLSQFWYQ
jgi:lipoprotein signal peptidase